MMKLNKQINPTLKHFFSLSTSKLSLCVSCVLLGTAVQATAVEEALSERIDFGNSYIMGQTIKSGAVYLTHRKKSKIESMLKMRVHYQEEILQDFDLGEPVVADEKAQ
jgi:hypothetical protein